MRKFVSYGPAFIVLLTAGAVLVGTPAILARISAARTQERVALARRNLSQDNELALLNASTRSVAEAVEPSVVHLEVATSLRRGASGSGWVYDAMGHIVTNAHVVGPATVVEVEFFDGRVERAEVLGTDPLTDIAVIRVTPGDYLVPARRATGERIARGDRVFAFGSPFNFKFSMSEGIVSGLGRTARSERGSPGITNYIQTDAAVNPGNSGGPLVDATSRVVGMNVAIATAENTSGGTEGQSAGISFAIPLTTIESRVQQLIEGNRPTSGYVGIVFDPRNPTPVGRGDYKGQGVRVRQVVPGEPADQAGLRAGDIITAIDGEAVSEGEVLRALIGSRRPGTKSALSLWRGDEQLRVDVNITRMPDSVLAQQYEEVLAYRFGIRLRASDDNQHVLIAFVAQDSAAEEAGLRAGDEVLALAGSPVNNLDQAVLLLADRGLFRGARVELVVQGSEVDAPQRTIRLRRDME